MGEALTALNAADGVQRVLVQLGVGALAASKLLLLLLKGPAWASQ